MIVSEEAKEFVDSDIYDNDDLIVDPNSPTRPKRVSNTIHATGKLVGNPSDTGRTRSQFESALYVKDPLFAERCYLIVELDTQTYEDSAHDPRWKTSMKNNSARSRRTTHGNWLISP